MARPISARAQAALNEARGAAARGGGRDPSGDVAPPAPSAVTPSDPSPPAPPAAAAAGRDAEMIDLVEQVADQTERARLRLAALSEAIDDLAWRVGPAPQAPGSERDGGTIAPMLIPMSPRAQAILDALERESEAARATAAAAPADASGRELLAQPDPASPGAETEAPALTPAESARRRRLRPNRGVSAGAATRPVPEPPVAATPEAGVSSRAARKLAVAMAMDGATRGEVAALLRTAHGVADPTMTLDAVFGPGTGDADPAR